MVFWKIIRADYKMNRLSEWILADGSFLLICNSK